MAYKGCQELARQAMKEPTPENEAAAFEGLLLAVDDIALFYNFARDLERVVPELLVTLANAGAGHSSEEARAAALQGQQAVAKQLGDIFAFALLFDQIRMARPFLSNDFSYYRRWLPKFSKHPNLRVKDDEASGMALFTAEPTPMIGCLIKAAARAMEKNENVTFVLALMANSCYKMVKTKRFENADTNLFCLRTMTGSIILYDHVDTLGAFSKRSPIPLKSCVTLLKKEFPNEEGLLNSIHYTTKHYKDAPRDIQELFGD